MLVQQLKLTRDGHSVDICIMCSEAKARAFRPDDNELNDDLDASSKDAWHT